MVSPELKLIVCENLEREVRKALEAERFQGVKVISTPARCHNLQANPAGPKADLGPNVCDLRAVSGCEALKGRAYLCQRPKMGLCFELLAGHEFLEPLLKQGCYLLTPGWLARWRECVKRWGFDQNTAREFFAESTSRLVLLDTLVDPNSAKELEEFAAFVQRPFEIVPVGLDFLRLFLKNLVHEWQIENQSAWAREAGKEAHQRLSDYAMAYDLMGRVSILKSEPQVVESIFDIFAMLFAPARLVYVPLLDGKPGVVRSWPAALATDQSISSSLLNLRESCAWTDSQNGFLLRIGEPDEIVGVLEVGEVAFPQYRQHYLNLAQSLAQVCGLAIRNSRIYETLEQKVVERTAELQEAVGELEHFSYTITHDMRAPLRAMQGLAGLLTEECSQCLSPTRREYLRLIAASAERMDRLITDALEYSGVLRQQPELEPIDTDALLRGILESYPNFHPSRAHIQIENNLPIVLGNKAAVTQCFSNLLGNAVKFVQPGILPKVHVWAESVQSQEPDAQGQSPSEKPDADKQKSPVKKSDTPALRPSTPFVRIWFEDQGIGIEKEYQDKIWGMFQRLNRSYGGTGIGLALVRKVVDRMGGKVGVESEPGHGSRFWIELKPAAPSLTQPSHKATHNE